MVGECIARLTAVGISYPNAVQLRRIAMTLHRWHELECGDGRGCIERDETTGKTYWLVSKTGKRYPTADREKGAQKRLGAILARYPGFAAYVQGDPRGASLYVLSPDQVPADGKLDSCYSRGIAVYR